MDTTLPKVIRGVNFVSGFVSAIIGTGPALSPKLTSKL